MGARKPGAKRMSARVVEDENYQLRYERVAGIDVAKAPGMVCLRLPPAPGKTRRTSRTWEVAATVPDIEALAAELKAAGVQKIAMESASDYWRALRQYTRQLVNLTGDRTRHWQRMEKLLEGALCKLSSVASGLAGSKSCLDMITAMIAGERDPHALADMAQGRMRAKHAALVKAFTGMQSGDEHAFTAASYLRMITGLDAGTGALEARISEHLAAIPAAWGVDADGVTGPAAGRGPDAAVLPAAARLDEIPGVSAQIAAGIIAEIGLDMSVFPTPQALVSWCGLAPVPHQSGPRKGRGKKGHGNSYARRLAVQAGDGAARTESFPGERHRRIRSRPGGGGWKKANAAVGRSVMIIVWHLLKDPSARYHDLGPDHYARHTDRNRKTRNHKRQLEALGYDVILTPRSEAA